MHAYQYRVVALIDFAANQSEMGITAIYLAFIGNHSEFAMLGVHQGLAHPMYIPLVLHAIANQFGNGEHLHSMLITELDQVGHASHGSVFAHDLANNSGGNQSRHASQIDRGFSLAGTD